MTGISVVAINTLGIPGVSSQAVHALTTAESPPSAPLAPLISRVSGNSLVVSWLTAFDTGGIPIRGYRTYIAPADDAHLPHMLACDSLRRYCEIAGLQRNTTYDAWCPTIGLLRCRLPSHPACLCT